jgi:hypothetical protein
VGVPPEGKMFFFEKKNQKTFTSLHPRKLTKARVTW